MPSNPSMSLNPNNRFSKSTKALLVIVRKLGFVLDGKRMRKAQLFPGPRTFCDNNQCGLQASGATLLLFSPKQ